MASYSRRTISVTREEFTVPVGPHGAPAAEIAKAWSAAERMYRNSRGLAEDAALADNAIVFRPGDDEIVISFETEEPSS
jgi:hypothetical protein